MLTSCVSDQTQLETQPPAGFVNLKSAMNDAGLDVRVDLRYLGSDNFVGEPVDGYAAEIVYISVEAAKALIEVQRALNDQQLMLKVFDAYRPQRAVDHFVRWAKDLENTTMKEKYYPGVDKKDLFSSGYIAERSGHSRGSTIDLTLVQANSGEELDMGTGWDFFDPLSWPSSDEVTESQKANRMLLRDAMLGAGFKPLTEEWWHFTLQNEPFVDRYFDFEIK